MFEPIVRNEKLAEELPPESWVLLSEIRYYIETRLQPLKDKIDKEEQLAGDDAALCTMVYFTPSGIRHCGYSQDLTKKMKSCFDNDYLHRDIELIWLKFDKKIQSMFN